MVLSKNMHLQANENANASSASHSSLVRQMADLGADFYRRGWVLGTSGNFSVVIDSQPLLLAITASGADKGALTSDRILYIDSGGEIISGSGKASDEALLHLAVVRERGAGAVLHTHSVWSTLLSDAFSSDGRLAIEGFEMLKGLAGVKTHEHHEDLPIIQNSQDMEALAVNFEDALREYPLSHGVLLRGHGLYTWGRDLVEARRHIEILEFLLEVVGRRYCANASRTIETEVT
jgi:methylthioribulose-1-phosphate dehydratase